MESSAMFVIKNIDDGTYFKGMNIGPYCDPEWTADVAEAKRWDELESEEAFRATYLSGANAQPEGIGA
jgi:hypothetical protein